MTIRRTPQDFVVEERLTAAFSAQVRESLEGADRRAGHLVYELTKTSLTTPEAAQGFAKALGVRSGVVDYAGLKDKHAQTVQHLTVPMEHLAASAKPPGELSARSWSAKLLGWSGLPAEAAAIDGNRFTIVVRDLAPQASAEMDRRAAILREPEDPALTGSRGLLIVNYFGDQRFGSARHGQGFVAAHLIRGEFEQALKLSIATPSRKDSGRTRDFSRMAATHWGKWKELAERLPRCPERRAIECLAQGGGDFRAAFAALPYFFQQLCVEAYQSHLWNSTARRLASRIAGLPAPAPDPGTVEPASQLRGHESSVAVAPVKPPRSAEAPRDSKRCLTTDDPFGQMVFPAAGVVESEWTSLELPLLARKTELVEPWRDEAAQVLAEEGIALDQLRIPGLRRPWFGEAARPLFITAAGFEMSPTDPDEMSSRGGGGVKRLQRTLKFDLPRGAYATVVLRRSVNRPVHGEFSSQTDRLGRPFREAALSRLTSRL